MRFQILILVSLLIVLPVAFPAAFAEQIIEQGSLSVIGSGISEKFIKPGVSTPATITFKVLPGFDNLIVDIGELGADQSQVQVDVRSCEERVCSIPVTLNLPTQGTPTARFSFYDQGGAEQKDVQYQFKVDTVGPQVLAIGTDALPKCSGQCAVRPGVNVIVVTYTDGTGSAAGSGIVPETITIAMPDGSTPNADWCNATQCNFTITLPQNNQPMTLSIVDTSTDAMGNKVRGVLSNAFIVDGVDPRISSITTRNLVSNQNVPVMTGSFEVQVVVEDDSRVVATADVTDFSELSEGVTENITAMTCDTTGVCRVRVTPKIGSYDGVIRIVVRDIAGNTVQNQTDPILVRKTIAEGGNFWTATTDIKPDTLDKGTVKFFKKHFYMPLLLTKQDVDAHIAYVSVDECRVSKDGNNVALPFDPPVVQAASTDFPTIALSLRSVSSGLDTLTGNLDVTCRINIMTERNGELYEKAESETVSATLQLVEYPLIPQKLSELKLQTQQDLQEKTQEVNQLKQVYTLAAGICGGIAQLATATTAGRVTQGTMPPPIDVAATPIRRATDNIEQATDSIRSSPIGQPLCFAAECKGADLLNNNLFYSDTGFGNFMKGFSGITTGAQDTQFLDPYRSVFVAYGTACLPAVVYHRQQQLGIMCNYNSCIQTQVEGGLPVSACMVQKSNLECRYLYGGLFYTSPGAIMQIVRDNILSLIKNPVSALGFTSTVACRVLPNHPNALCNIPKHVDNVHKSVATLTRLKRLGETVTQPAPQDACAIAQQRIDTFHANLVTTSNCNINYCVTGDIIELHGRIWRVVPQTPPTEGTTLEQQQYQALKPGYTIVQVPDSQTSSQEVKDKLAINRADCAKQGSCASAQGSLNTYFGSNDAAINRIMSESKAKIDAATTERDTAQKSLSEFRGKLDASIRLSGIDSVNAAIEALAADAKGFMSQGDREKLDRNLQKLAEKTSKAGLTAAERAELVKNSDAVKSIEKAYEKNLADKNKKLKEEEKNRLNDLKKQLNEDELRRIKENTQYTLTKGMKVALQLSDITQTASQFGLNLPKFIRGYGPEIDNSALGKATDFETQFLDAACDGRIRQDEFVLGLDSKERIGLYLYGTKASGEVIESIDEETEQKQWQYVVGGQVRFDARNQDSYTITLEGAGSSVELFKMEMPADETSAVDMSKSFGAANLLSHDDDIEYSRACIRFDHKDVNDLFQTTQSDGQETCVPLAVRR